MGWRHLDKSAKLAECRGERPRMGCRWSEVQILSPRPVSFHGLGGLYTFTHSSELGAVYTDVYTILPHGVIHGALSRFEVRVTVHHLVGLNSVGVEAILSCIGSRCLRSGAFMRDRSEIPP